MFDVSGTTHAATAVAHDGMLASQALADPRLRQEVEQAWSAHLTPPPGTGKIRGAWRKAHFEAQDGRCAYCFIRMAPHGGPGPRDRWVTLDHIIPLSAGGPDTQRNTLACCKACNTAKGAMDVRAFALEPARLRRLAEVNRVPDRLSVDPGSPFHCGDLLERGVRVLFRDRERHDVDEYCISASWVKIRHPRTRDRRGQPLLVKLIGKTYALLEARFPDPMGWAL